MENVSYRAILHVFSEVARFLDTDPGSGGVSIISGPRKLIDPVKGNVLSPRRRKSGKIREAKSP